MMQIIEQTHEEKVKMYMKARKIQLIEMLIECNRIIDAQSQAGKYLAQPDVSGSISCDDMEDIIERFYLNHKTGTIENWLIAHPETKIIICEIMDKRNKKYYH